LSGNVSQRIRRVIGQRRARSSILGADAFVGEPKLCGRLRVKKPPTVDDDRGAHEPRGFTKVEPGEIAVCRHKDERVGLRVSGPLISDLPPGAVPNSQHTPHEGGSPH
jgi:hypothetical protein